MTELFKKGLAIREAVLGKKAVSRSLDGASEFDMPMQELVTEYCWGTVWAREGLDRRTRSMLNIALLTTLNRGTELKAHVRGALNNGCTPAEIREVLMHVAIYSGVPAALEGFRHAKEVLAEEQSE